MNEKLITDEMVRAYKAAFTKAMDEALASIAFAGLSPNLSDRACRDGLAAALSLTPSPAVNVGAVTDEMVEAGYAEYCRRINLFRTNERDHRGLATFRSALEAALTSPQGEETPAAPSPEADVEGRDRGGLKWKRTSDGYVSKDERFTITKTQGRAYTRGPFRNWWSVRDAVTGAGHNDLPSLVEAKQWAEDRL